MRTQPSNPELAAVREMPNSPEAEEYLISCCLLDGPDVVARCIEARIGKDSFYDQRNTLIFERILELYNAQKPIAVDVIAEELKTAGQLDAVGGYAFLTQVSGRIPTTAQASYFIEKVREQAMLRAMIRSATSVVEDCYGFSGGIEEFVDQQEARFFAVTQNRVGDNSKATRVIVKQAMGVIDGMIQRRGEMTGVRSGFRDLDNLTWGFQKTDMIVLAARPSMGKTALALNIAENVAIPTKGKGQAVQVFSLEMNAPQLITRMLCSRARVNMKLLRDGFLSKTGEEQQRITAASAQIAEAPLFIDDAPGVTVGYIRAKARRRHARTPLALIVVDYLQLISASDPRMIREQQVAEASRGLKALAKELDVPVIVLSQLSRRSEQDKRKPVLSDLRESGAIEQDADVVMLISRPADADENFQVASGVADLTIAKARNGPVGELKLTFLRDITRFENYHQ